MIREEPWLRSSLTPRCRAARLAHRTRSEYFARMNAVPEIVDHAREQPLARARRAFREHHAGCFWSSDPAMEITEDDIPFVIAGLRKNGGHKEWREAQALVAPR